MLQAPLLISLSIYKYKNKVKLWKVCYGCCNLFASRDHLKVGFFQKVMAKSSNLSNRHACEPNIVLEPLFPVHIVNIRIVLFWKNFVKTSAYFELQSKN